MANTDSTVTTLPAKTFGERLIEALECRGITDLVQQVEKVALAFRVKPKTAQKYLQSESCTAFLKRNDYVFWEFAKNIGVDGWWLLHGGITFEDMRFLEYIRSLTKWERTKTFRYGVR